MSRRPDLLIANGELAGRRFPVKEGGLRLGRSSSNDVHVPDEELSRNHCLFEPVGEDGLRVTDLASANGTIVNGRALGIDPLVIRSGDVIEVGKTVIKVVGEEPTKTVTGDVDLGFGPKGVPVPPVPSVRRRSRLANLILPVLVAAAATAVCLVLFTERADEPAPAAVEATEPTVCEVSYEKVEADAEGIFRFELKLGGDGVLRAVVDDVPKENRHLAKSVELGAAARATLGEILAYRTLKGIDPEYAGAEPDPPALRSWTLRVVYDSHVRTVRVTNTQEPEAFRTVRERLEAFAKNELGVWAIQYSRDRLVALAEEAASLGRAKYGDRDVNYGNLSAAVTAYREALFYLETIDPKPPCHREAVEGLEKARQELDRRYADQRFLANRAINLGQWETARRELGVLLEMVPDRNDDRYREASAKLVDVEARMTKGGR